MVHSFQSNQCNKRLLKKELATVFAVGLIVGSTITLFVLPALMAMFVENFRFKLVRCGELQDAGR
jgi:hypothetical protein